MSNQIDVVIADAQPIFRSGLQQILKTVNCFNLVGEAFDGKSALKVVTNTKPDVAILDIDIPKKDGFEVARALFARSMSVEVIFLTIHKSEKFFNAALNLGVKGYILKDSATSELIEAIKTVSDGKSFICPRLSSFLVKRNRGGNSFVKTTPAITDLTRCEKRVLIMVGQYMTSKDIAAELFISTRTIEHHREHIAAKLGLHGRNALLKFTLEHQNELNL